MMLARKFAVTFFIAMCAVLGAEAYLTTRREMILVETDLDRDHDVMGHTLARAAERILRVDGEQAALDFIEKVNQDHTNVTARWVWLDAPPGSPGHADLDADRLRLLQEGKKVSLLDAKKGGVGYLHTYVTVPGDSTRPGAIELAESLAEEQERTSAILGRVLLTTASIAVLSGLLATVLGLWLVGRPTSLLIQRAQAIGAGDLTGRLVPRHKDELSLLARELNAMCDRLAEAKERVAVETAGRIKALEQLRRADRLATVGKLAAGVAHELGTPLNVVWARAKMIASSSQDGSEASTNARIIADQSENMTKIIRQLLDFARPRSPRKMRIDLWEAVRHVLGLLGMIAEKRNVALVPVGDETPAFAEVDPDQIQQVVSNLVLNGIHSMQKGGALTVQITRAMAKPPGGREGAERECLVLSVRDQGAGITDEIKTHLFEPFFTTKGVGEGTGLGLSVSLGIIQEHGGWIAVESEADRGSCFSVYLPG